MLPWLLNNTLAAAGLALVIFLVCRLGRFRPAIQHALWLVVLVKLLTPGWVAWPWSPQAFLGRPVPTAVVSSSAPESPVPQSFPAPERQPEAAAADRAAMSQSNATPSTLESRSAIRPVAPSPNLIPLEPEPRTLNPGIPDWLSQSILNSWALGAAVVLVLQAVHAIRFRRLVAWGEPFAGELADQLDRLAGRLGLRPPKARVVPGLASPFLWCLGKPTLLWPSGLEQNLAPGALRTLLLHELAHLRRRDHWVAWLEMIGVTVWWWNPLFWYVRRRLRQCAEMACDAWVVWALPDARRAYAESLVTVTELASQSRAVAPAWGAIGEARNLERRLTMIFRNDVRRNLPWSGLLVILLVAIIVLPGWSRGQGEEGQSSPPAPQAASSPSGPENSPARLEPAVPGRTMPTAEPDGDPGNAPPAQSELYVPKPMFPGAPTSRPQSTPATKAVPSAMPAPEPVPTTIRMFPLKHRDPTEMIPIIAGLWGLSSEHVNIIVPGQAENRIGGAVGLLSRVRSPEPVVSWPIPGPESPSRFGRGTGGRSRAMMVSIGNSVRLAADPPTKSIIARGAVDDVDRLARLIAAFDTPGQDLSHQLEKLGNVHALTLQHRSVEEIANILKGLGISVRQISLGMANKKLESGESRGTMIAIGPERDVAEIRRLIESLDVQEGEAKAAEAAPEQSPIPKLPNPKLP